MVIEQEGPLVFPFSLFFSHLRYFSTSKVGSRAWIVYFHGLLWTMYIVTSCVLCKKKNSRNRKQGNDEVTITCIADTAVLWPSLLVDIVLLPICVITSSWFSPGSPNVFLYLSQLTQLLSPSFRASLPSSFLSLWASTFFLHRHFFIPDLRQSRPLSACLPCSARPLRP